MKIYLNETGWALKRIKLSDVEHEITEEEFEDLKKGNQVLCIEKGKVKKKKGKRPETLEQKVARLEKELKKK